MKIQEILKIENVGKGFVADCICEFVVAVNKWGNLDLLLIYGCEGQFEDEFTSITDVWSLEAILNTEFEEVEGEGE